MEMNKKTQFNIGQPVYADKGEGGLVARRQLPLPPAIDRKLGAALWRLRRERQTVTADHVRLEIGRTEACDLWLPLLRRIQPGKC